MTRQEYNDFRYIRSYKTKGFPLNYGTTLRIPTARSGENWFDTEEEFEEWKEEQEDEEDEKEAEDTEEE